MIVCVAGKNSIAVDVLGDLVKRVGAASVVALPNSTDPGIDRWQPSLSAAARRMGVREVTLDDLYPIEELVFLSLEFDRIIRPDAFVTDFLFNVHFSLLPAYKGMYTSFWPIFNGERESGVTLHCIDAGIDTGDVIAQERVPIADIATARDLYHSYLHAGFCLVRKHLAMLLDPSRGFPRRAQPVAGASYYSKSSIDYSQIGLDLRKSAWEVHNQARALTFREYQMPTLLGRRIRRTSPTADRSASKPGTLVADSRWEIVVATIDYDLVAKIDLLPELVGLCRTGRRGEVLELLNAGEFDLDEWDEEGTTPLLAAVEGGDRVIVAELLRRGADPRRGNWAGELPAERAGASSEIRDLLAGGTLS